MAAVAADPAVRHIVLFCHWAIAPAGRDFVHPIIDACPSNRQNDNRRRLLALCTRYGCDLFINGHEHNDAWPVGHVGPLADVNCGTVTSEKGAFAIVEIHPDHARFTVYDRAVAEERNGAVVYTRLPARRFVRDVPLRARG